MHLFVESIGGWTFSLGSYYVQNITRLLDNPYFQVMADIVDPYGITFTLFIDKLPFSLFSLLWSISKY